MLDNKTFTVYNVGLSSFGFAKIDYFVILTIIWTEIKMALFDDRINIRVSNGCNNNTLLDILLNM